MKKVPLKRRTPLRQGTKGLRKSKLSPMSKDKSKWMKLYRVMRKQDPVGPQAHHPFGRQGDYLLAYLVIPAWLHEGIHEHGSKSREQGWLQPPFEGKPYDPNYPRPWYAWEEDRWPQHLKRPA